MALDSPRPTNLQYRHKILSTWHHISGFSSRICINVTF